MLDNQVIIAMRDTLVPMLARRGIAAQVKQSAQPTQQGVPNGALIFFTKVLDTRYGWPERSTNFDLDALEMTATHSEQIESTYQFSCIVPQNPDNDYERTPADVLKTVARILQTDEAIQLLRAKEIGLLRIEQLRSTVTIDDRGQYMTNPSFDIVLTHRDTESQIIGIVSSQSVNINRV